MLNVSCNIGIVNTSCAKPTKTSAVLLISKYMVKKYGFEEAVYRKYKLKLKLSK